MTRKPDPSLPSPGPPAETSLLDHLEAATEQPRYDLGPPLGSGSTSEVRSAHDRLLHRDIAVKFLVNTGPTTRARFRTEAQVTAQLEHPNIIPVHDFGVQPDGQPYLIMKRVQGRSLWELVKAGELGLEQRLDVFRKVCDAVAFAHSRGVLHRDLKTENVMVGAFGEVLVMDWGLAGPIGMVPEAETRFTDSPSAPSLQVDRFREGSLRTQDGTVMGTPAYMPPEQAEGRLADLDPRSDIYGLGAILYELLTDRQPFDGPVYHVLAAVKAGRLRPPRKVNPRVPRELEAIVLKAMALRPWQRYPTVDALRQDVDAWMEHRPLVHVRSSLAERASKWADRHRAPVRAGAWVAALAGAVLLLAAVRYTTDVGEARDAAIAESERARTAEAETRSSLLQAQIALADSLWSQGRPLESWSLLRTAADQSHPDQVDRRPLDLALSLQASRSPPPVSRCAPHDGRPVRALALEEEGERAWSWGDDGRVVAWDPAGCAEITSIPVAGPPGPGAFDLTADAVAVATGDQLQVVDLTTRATAVVPLGSPVDRVGWAGGRVWVAWNDGRLAWLDPASRRLTGPTVSPGGGWWTPGADGRFQVGVSAPTGHEIGGLWETATARAVQTGSGVNTAALSPDGRRFLWGTSMDLSLVEVATGAVTWTRPHDPVLLVGTEPAGELAWIAGFNGSLELVRLDDGAVVATFAGEEVTTRAAEAGDEAAFSVATTRRARLLAVGGDTGWISVFLRPLLSTLFPPDGRGAVTQGLAVHPSSRLVATADDLGVIRLLDIPTGRLVRRWEATPRGVRQVAFSPDGRQIAAAVRFDGVAVWDLETGAVVSRTPMEVRSVSVAWTDPHTLLAGDADGNLLRIEADTGDAVSLGRKMRAGLWDITPLGEGLALIAGHIGEEHTLKVVSAVDGAMHALQASDSAAYHHALARDGRTVALARQDGTVVLWDWEKNRENRVIRADEGPTMGVAFSPDGALLATGGFGSRVQIWDVATGRRLWSVSQHQGPVTNLAWSPDGATLLSTGGQGLALLPVDAVRVLEQARADLRADSLNDRARALADLGWWERVVPTLERALARGGTDDPTLRARAALALDHPPVFRSRPPATEPSPEEDLLVRILRATQTAPAP